MPPKKTKTKKRTASKKSPVVCSFHGPGPQYKLKPVVGYNDHCVSRYRNPAYSIAAKQTGGDMGSDSPGPIYYVELPKAPGFTIGVAQRGGMPECTPGPYLLPDPPRNPQFSIKWRTPLRRTQECTGLYNLPSTLNGPAFSIIPKADDGHCVGGPIPPPLNLDPIKPRAPAYSLGFRQTDSGVCGGPGKYYPKDLDKGPAYTFGEKHHPCKQPYITECDEVC